MKSNTVKRAKIELDILCQTVKSPIIKDFIPEILALVDRFGNSGQSGGSAPYVASAISEAVKKLCLQEPICEIMGHDSEWGNPLGINEYECIQNKRLSSLFKDDKGVYYLDAIIWKTQKNISWSGNATLKSGVKINSSQYIKGFPFKPKKFVIDVIEHEISKDNWKFIVKDESQLIPVFEYYKESFQK